MRINEVLTAMKRFEIIQAIVLFLFFFPLFFQLSGNVFTDTGFNFDAEGRLLLTPLPIAMVICFIGIAVLLRWENKHFGVGYIFAVFVLSMFSVLITAASSGKAELAKFVLLIQFLIPMFGFVLGQLYIEPESLYLTLEALILYVLMLIVPAQVIITLMRGTGLLVREAGLFSLYQHLQYLPMIFVSLYFFSVVRLSEHKVFKGIIIFLAPWIGVYIAASLSLTLVIFSGLMILAITAILLVKRQVILAITLVALIGGLFLFHYPSVQATSTYSKKYTQQTITQNKKNTNDGQYNYTKNELDFINNQQIEWGERQRKYQKYMWYKYLPNNIKERLVYWEYYSDAVFTNFKTLLFGHETRPDRIKYPSAHNYYLDFAYHFGVIALLPIIYLIGITLYRASRVLMAKKITPSMQVLLVIVLFLLLVDNSVKVGLKQPYPGLIMFFLWGLLLQVLDKRMLGKSKHYAAKSK